jgi:hypothetical protein
MRTVCDGLLVILLGLLCRTDHSGTISMREGKLELWSDQGYMIPPFPACESS